MDRDHVRARAGAGDPRRRGRCEDARLPCWSSMATAASMDLSILILNYNTREHLRACLASLLAEGSTSLSGGPIQAEVIVVDNASTDGSAELVSAEFPWAALIRSPRNGGFANGNNQGLARSRGAAILLLNPDTLLPAGGIAGLMTALA